jgi:hypothetical protein
MNFIQRIRKKRELMNMCKNLLIKSLVEHTHISKDIQKKLYSKIEIAENEGNYVCMLESFVLYWADGEYEVSIPYMDLYEIIEKNIEIKYRITDINYNNWSKWKNIKFVNR